MDSLQRGLISLLRSSLTGETLPLPEDFDLETAYPQILRHAVVTMAYDGAVRCGLDKHLPVMKKLFQGYVACLLKSEEQLKAAEQICTAFSAADVDYMLLKGCNLKPLYPKPEFRAMGDVDILIRKGQYDKIRPVLQKMGFAEQLESDHELIWMRQDLLLELHKHPIPSYNRDYYRYFGDGWQLAKSDGCHRHSMTAEDEYVFLLTHFAKHYRDGGIGCRHVVDLWVWRKSFPGMDEAYIADKLALLRLSEFEQNMRRVLAVWFEGAVSDEKTEFITNTIFHSGAWGSREAHAISAGAKSAAQAGSSAKGVVLRAFRLVFPGAVGMHNRYPILKKYPALTPVFWPVRWITAVLFRRDNIRRSQEDLLSVTPDQIESCRQALQYVGLNYMTKD